MSSRESDSVDSGEYADGGAPRRLRLILRELQQTNTSGSLTEAGAPSVGEYDLHISRSNGYHENQTLLIGTAYLTIPHG